MFLHTWFESYIIELYRRKATEHCNQTNFASSVLALSQVLDKHHQSLEELAVSRSRKTRRPTITAETTEHRTGRSPSLDHTQYLFKNKHRSIESQEEKTP